MKTIQLQTLVLALAATVSFGQNTLCGRPFDFSLPAGTDRTNAVSAALLSELAYHYSVWTNYSIIFETEAQGQTVDPPAQDLPRIGLLPTRRNCSSSPPDCLLQTHWRTPTILFIRLC